MPVHTDKREWYVIFEYETSDGRKLSSTYRESAVGLTQAITQACLEYANQNCYTFDRAQDDLLEAGPFVRPGKVCACAVPSIVEAQACRICGKPPR